MSSLPYTVSQPNTASPLPTEPISTRDNLYSRYDPRWTDIYNQALKSGKFYKPSMWQILGLFAENISCGLIRSSNFMAEYPSSTIDLKDEIVYLNTNYLKNGQE